MLHPEKIWAVGDISRNCVDVYLAWWNASRKDYIYRKVTEGPVGLEEALKVGKTIRGSRKKFLDLVLAGHTHTEMPDETRVVIEEWHHQ